MSWRSHPSKGLIFSVACLHFAKSHGWPSRESGGSDPLLELFFSAILVASVPVWRGLDPSFQTCLVRFKLESGLIWFNGFDNNVPRDFILLVPFFGIMLCITSISDPNCPKDILSPDLPLLPPKHQRFTSIMRGHWWNQCRKSLGVGHWTTMNLKMKWSFGPLFYVFGDEKGGQIIENYWKSVIYLWFFNMARQHSVKTRRTWWNYIPKFWEIEIPVLRNKIQRPAPSSQQSIARGWVRSSGKNCWQLKLVDWACKKGRLPCWIVFQLLTVLRT